MAEADSQRGYRFSPAADSGHCYARLGRGAGPGRDHHSRDAHRSDFIDCDLVVAPDDRTLTKLAQVLDEVVGEGIVVVEDETHC